MSGEEYRPGADEVAGPPAEQQEAAVGDDVGGRDPGQDVRPHMQAGLDLRQRDLGNGQVERVKEDRRADDRQQQTRGPRCARHRFCSGSIMEGPGHSR